MNALDTILFRELTHAAVNLRAAQRGYTQLRATGTVVEKDKQGLIVQERADKVDEILKDIRANLPHIWGV